MPRTFDFMTLSMPLIEANRVERPVQDGQVLPRPVNHSEIAVVKCMLHHCGVTTQTRASFIACADCRTRLYCSRDCAQDDQFWHELYCSHDTSTLARAFFDENETIIGSIALTSIYPPPPRLQPIDIADYKRQALKRTTNLNVRSVLLEDRARFRILVLHLENVSVVPNDADAPLISTRDRLQSGLAITVNVDTSPRVYDYHFFKDLSEALAMRANNQTPFPCHAASSSLLDHQLIVSRSNMNLLKIKNPTQHITDYISGNLPYPLQCTRDPFYAISFIAVSDDESYIVYALDSAFDRLPPTSLPPKLEQDHHHRPLYINLGQARFLNYLYKGQPYLPFIPINDIFEGPIFHRFSGTRESFEELVHLRPDGRYLFNPLVADSWVRVEQALIKLCRAFYTPLVNINTPTYPYPSHTKFNQPKDNLGQVLHAVFFARKLIVFLVAELRYSIACSPHVGDKSWTYVWSQLDGVRHFDLEWMGNLARSKAMTSETLAGCIVELPSLTHAYTMHRFAYHHVPVHLIIGSVHINSQARSWIEFATNNFTGVSLEMDKLCSIITQRWNSDAPQDVQINDPHDNFGLPPRPPSPDWSSSFSPQHHYPLLSRYSPPPSRKAPYSSPVPDGLPDDQLEWWYDHWRDVELMKRDGDGTDSDEIQELRLNSLLDSLKVNLDASELQEGYNSDWYYWEPTPLHPLFLVRRKLHRSDVEKMWPHIGDHHRVYNQFRDEWDLYHPSCNFQTADRSTTIRYEIDNVLDDFDIQVFLKFKPLRPVTPEYIDFTMDNSTLLDVENHCHRQEPGVQIQPAPKYALDRFGFSPLSTASADGQEQPSWWYWLGVGTGVTDRSLGDLVYSILNNSILRLKTTLDIYTLRSQLIQSGTFTIRRYPNAVITTTTTRTSNLYLLSFSSREDLEWILAVPNAADIVLALRMGWTDSRANMIRQYLKVGVVFFTLAPQMSSIDTSLKVKLESLVPVLVVPKDEKYHLSDFYEYQTKREAFLDGPFGRCAARMGGVSARLWRKNVDKFEQRFQSVLAGPTEIASWIGVQVSCGNEAFYDDALTPEMDAFVSGQYYMPFDDPNVIDINKLLSWYPTNAVFNYRYVLPNATWNSRWSIRHEEMFNEWEAMIYRKVSLQTSGKWKRGFNNRPPQLDAAYEAHCIDFIEEYIVKRR